MINKSPQFLIYLKPEIFRRISFEKKSWYRSKKSISRTQRNGGIIIENKISNTYPLHDPQIFRIQIEMKNNLCAISVSSTDDYSGKIVSTASLFTISIRRGKSRVNEDRFNVPVARARDADNALHPSTRWWMSFYPACPRWKLVIV